MDLPVLRGQHLRPPQRVEDPPVQQFVTQLAIEALHVAVVAIAAEFRRMRGDRPLIGTKQT